MGTVDSRQGSHELESFQKRVVMDKKNEFLGVIGKPEDIERMQRILAGEEETTQAIFIPDAAQKWIDTVTPQIKRSVEILGKPLLIESGSRTVLTYAQKIEAGIIVPPVVKRQSWLRRFRYRVTNFLFYWKHYLRDFYHDRPRW